MARTARKTVTKAAGKPGAKSKRLIVCCDGTWQDLKSDDPTNVRRIAELTSTVGKDGKPQVVYYDGGVGSGGGLINSLLGGAAGSGIDENIKEAYRFIALNYSEGDEIYMFGFSRGAYTVRSLAGLIYASGLVKRGDLSSVPDAYALYRDPKVKASHPKAKSFRKGKFEPDITFLGCWDTVGSLGVPDLFKFTDVDERINRVYEFHDCRLNPKILHARHAAAIDEDRDVFSLTEMKEHETRTGTQLIQLWFPGGHGGVGGGDHKIAPHSNSALAWMMGEATAAAGLAFEIKPDELDRNPLAPLHISKKFVSLRRLGTSSREIIGGFAALHEAAKERWRGKPGWRPEKLKPFAPQLNA